MLLEQVCIKRGLIIKRSLIHSNREKPIAETASVNAAPHSVLSTMMEPMAALFWLLVVVPVGVAAVVEIGRDVLGVTVGVVVVEVVDVNVDVKVEVDVDVDVDARVLPAVTVGEVRYGGGGTAVEGSFRAPVPHGIFAPVVG